MGIRWNVKFLTGPASNGMTSVNGALKNLLQNHNRFVLAAQDNLPLYVLFAKEALGALLSGVGKQLFSYPQLPQDVQNDYTDILHFSPHSAISSEIIISFPENASLEEVRFQEDGRSIIITPKAKINRSDIEIIELKPDAEAGFFFSPYADDFIKTLSLHVVVPPREKIVFFTENKRTLAEKIFDVYDALDGTYTETPFATLAYASLAGETENFQKNISAETFEAARKLIEFGADKNALRAIEERKKRISSANLFGRALARTRIDERAASSWTFLTEKDFEKTGKAFVGSYPLPQFMRTLRAALPQTHASFLLWENGGKIDACLYSENEKMISFFAEHLGKSDSSAHVIMNGFANFSEAEIKIRELLKAAKYDTI